MLIPLPLPCVLSAPYLFRRNLLSGGDVGLSRLFVTTTTVGNVGLAETTLASFAIPGGTLAVNGDAVVLTAWIQCAGNNNGKRTKVIYGGTTIGDSTAQGFNGVGFVITAVVFRTGATTQKAISGILQPNVNASWAIAAGGGFNTSTPGETLSGPVTISITGQSTNVGADNDVQLLAMAIDKIPGG